MNNSNSLNHPHPERWKRSGLRTPSRYRQLLVCSTLLLLGMGLGAAGAVGQALEDHPGFVAFERFGDLDYDNLTIEINLGGSLLQMLSGAIDDDSGEFGKLLKGLSLIKVNVFEASGSSQANDQLRQAVSLLRRDGWEAVVSIRQEENLHILVRSDGDAIQGVLAAFADDESFGLVNIVGSFDPAQIGRLARQLDIGPLEGFGVGTVGTDKRKPEDREEHDR